MRERTGSVKPSPSTSRPDLSRRANAKIDRIRRSGIDWYGYAGNFVTAYDSTRCVL